MILSGGQGLCLELDGSHELFASPESQADLRARPKIKLCKASSSSPPLLLSASLKVTTEGGLFTPPSVPLSSRPWAGSQHCWDSLEQWARRVLCLCFCPSLWPCLFGHGVPAFTKVYEEPALIKIACPWCNEATPLAGSCACNVTQTTSGRGCAVPAVPEHPTTPSRSSLARILSKKELKGRDRTYPFFGIQHPHLKVIFTVFGLRFAEFYEAHFYSQYEIIKWFRAWH